MNQIQAMYEAKNLLGQKSLKNWASESWIKLSDNGWEMNVWQEEETGKYRCAVFPIDSDGDIFGKGIDVYSKEMIDEEKYYNVTYRYTLPHVNPEDNVIEQSFNDILGKSILSICFPDNDIFDHLVLFLTESKIQGEN